MNIINDRLKISLQALLNKRFDMISDADLAKLKFVAIDSSGLSKEGAENDINSVLSSCQNLEEILIKNTFITQSIMASLSQRKITRMHFDKCAFEEENNISFSPSLKDFKMRKCYLDDYSTLLANLPQGLELLNISYPADESVLDLSLLNNISSLKALLLDGCILNWNNCILNDCECLSLLGTEVTEDMATSISKLPELRELYISERFNYLDAIQSLFDKIKVKNNLNEFVVDEETINKNL